jgi:hypothetical protein
VHAVKPRAVRWLLPHERWLGSFAGRVTNPMPGGQRWRFQRNYVPDGDACLAACAADTAAALVLLFGGAILLGSSGDRGMLATAGNWLLNAAIVFSLVALARGIQLAHVGRTFRAGKPYIRARQR